MTRTLIAPDRLGRGRARVAYRIVLVAVVVVFALVFLGPLYWMVTGGLKTAQETAQTPPSWLPAHPDPGNYVTAWHQLSLARLLANTVLYAAGALAFQLVFDVAAAYALSTLRPALGGVVLGLMLATLMVPAAVPDGPAVPDRRGPAAAAPEPAQHAVGDLAAVGHQRVQRVPAEAVLRRDPRRPAGRRGGGRRRPGPYVVLGGAADLPAGARRGVDLRGHVLQRNIMAGLSAGSLKG